MKQIILNFIINIIRLLPLKKNKIIFHSWNGKKYGCNPKYISIKASEIYPQWDIVWAFNEIKSHKIPNIREVKFGTLKHIYELYTSKVIVSNVRFPQFFSKRKGQIYLQTWHSALRLKQIEKDVEETLPASYIKLAQNDGNQIDFLLSGCEKSTEIFERCFWNKGKIIELGSPRNDILTSLTPTGEIRLKEKIGVSTEKIVLLYAPTFRSNDDISIYDLDFERIRKAIYKSYNKDCEILLRLHPNISHLSKKISSKYEYIKDTSDHDDIQELLAISDILITDYSSLMFDFLLTKRPIILYVPDLEDYVKKERKLYFKIESLPMIKCHNQEDLIKILQNIENESFRLNIDVNSFFNENMFFHTKDSSETVVKFLSQYLS